MYYKDLNIHILHCKPIDLLFCHRRWGRVAVKYLPYIVTNIIMPKKEAQYMTINTRIQPSEVLTTNLPTQLEPPKKFRARPLAQTNVSTTQTRTVTSAPETVISRYVPTTYVWTIFQVLSKNHKQNKRLGWIHLRNQGQTQSVDSDVEIVKDVWTAMVRQHIRRRRSRIVYGIVMLASNSISFVMLFTSLYFLLLRIFDKHPEVKDIKVWSFESNIVLTGSHILASDLFPKAQRWHRWTDEFNNRWGHFDAIKIVPTEIRPMLLLGS